MNTDDRAMAILENLRPQSTVQEAWPVADREAALEGVLASRAPALPVRSRRRRVLVTTAVTAALLATGAGVATASGVLPESFTQELSFWTSETKGGVDVDTAHRVAQAPGPDGTVLSVWAGTGSNGTTCVSPMFEAPGDLDRPAPASVRAAGGQCTPANTRETFGSLGGSADDRGIHTMWGPGGEAVRAELRLPDGTVRPGLYAEGMYFYWYLANETVKAPFLVGYDASGKVVFERQLPNLITNAGR
ncbi:hypothetical protein [Micromonospora sp. CPCC 206061]|uniref:hypothetical protein n=1 Tax=Micromonospora sp. CPCC 206061 TaxID=3122410 RepID=UPI002FF189BC